MTNRTLASESGGMQRPPRQTGGAWNWIAIALIVGVGAVFLVGLFDLIGLIHPAQWSTAQPAATVAPLVDHEPVAKATPAPAIKPTAVPDSGWTIGSVHITNPFKGVTIPGLSSTVVEHIECKAVDNRPGGCGSLTLGPKPEYPISANLIDALPLLYVENFCWKGSCVKVRHNAHGLDSQVPPGFEWEQKLYDDCAKKGLKLLDNDEGFYCG